MSFHWHVAYTHVHKERIAIQHLEQQGFQAYAPLYQKTRRHARREEKVLAPLFPRYIFVGWDDEKGRWSAIRSTRGISYLLQNKEAIPLVIPTALIDELKAQENAKGLVPLEVLHLFQKGDKIRITEGAFENCLGTFEGLDEKQRVQILLDFMQREIKITLPLHSIETV